MTGSGEITTWKFICKDIKIWKTVNDQNLALNISKQHITLGNSAKKDLNEWIHTFLIISLLCSLSSHCKLKIVRFWTVGRTKQVIWSQQIRLWETNIIDNGNIWHFPPSLWVQLTAVVFILAALWLEIPVLSLLVCVTRDQRKLLKMSFIVSYCFSSVSCLFSSEKIVWKCVFVCVECYWIRPGGRHHVWCGYI